MVVNVGARLINPGYWCKIAKVKAGPLAKTGKNKTYLFIFAAGASLFRIIKQKNNGNAQPIFPFTDDWICFPTVKPHPCTIYNDRPENKEHENQSD